MIPSYPRLVERGLGKEEWGEARDLFVARTRNVANVYVRHMDARVSTKSEEIPVSFFPLLERKEGRKEGNTLVLVKQIRMNKFPLHRVTASMFSSSLFSPSFLSPFLFGVAIRLDVELDLDGLVKRVDFISRKLR